MFCKGRHADLVDAILTSRRLESEPPVLVDIGASGSLHPKWQQIAKYSTCIAFDADSREMGFIEKESDTFRKLIVFNSVATDQQGREQPFF